MNQQDPVLFAGAGENERFGVQCQDFGATLGVLWFQEGSLSYEVVQMDAVQKIPNLRGAYALLLFAMQKRLGFAQFVPAHFGINDDVRRHSLVNDAVSRGYVWWLAVPVSAAIRDVGSVGFIAEDSRYPLCVRAAVLPRATLRVSAESVIIDAHSSHWCRGTNGEPSDAIEVLGTTAAYVHATFAGIPFDDPDGLRYIRTEATCAVLAQSGKMPWVAERLKAMGRLGI